MDVFVPTCCLNHVALHSFFSLTKRHYCDIVTSQNSPGICWKTFGNGWIDTMLPENCSPCGKCGRPVHCRDDVAYFDFMREKMRLHGIHFVDAVVDPWVNTALLKTQSWHLLPLKDGDEVVCEGSPSRYQYLEGQPRDTRCDMRYMAELEVVSRAAYARLQKEEA